jgi:hypothetical protein
MLKKILYITAFATLTTACSSHQAASTAMEQKTEPAPAEAQQQENLTRIDSGSTDLHIFKYNGRIYVIGNEETSADFVKHKHLPYTKTLLGAGPKGETVIFEVDKDDSSYAEALIDEYNSIPWIIEQNSTYTAWKYQGRIYVIGNDATNESFAKHKHLPYTKTILGAGPAGETVIFEVDKNDPEFAEKLKQAYMADTKE